MALNLARQKLAFSQARAGCVAIGELRRMRSPAGVRGDRCDVRDFVSRPERIMLQLQQGCDLVCHPGGLAPACGLCCTTDWKPVGTYRVTRAGRCEGAPPATNR